MMTSPKASDQLNISHSSSSQENVSHFQVIIDVFSKEPRPLGKISSSSQILVSTGDEIEKMNLTTHYILI